MIIESGKAIGIRRKAYDLTQEKLAETLGVDVTTIQNWEAGKRVGMSNMKPLYMTLGFDNILPYAEFKILVTEGKIEHQRVDSYESFELNGVELGKKLFQLEDELKKAEDEISNLVADQEEERDMIRFENEQKHKIYLVQQAEIKMLKAEKEMLMERLFKFHDRIEELTKIIEGQSQND